MTGALAPLLAALATAAAFGALAWGSADRPAVVAVRRAPGRPGTGLLHAIAGWPLIRRVQISHRTSERLDASGKAWDARDVMTAKVVGSTFAIVAGVVVMQPLLACMIAVIAWRSPDLVIARLAGRRLVEADREIPVMLDLLAVATSAGLPPQLAFRRSVNVAVGPLSEELSGVVNATDLGGRWRDELRKVGDRIGLADLRRLVGALTRADALGSSLAEEISRLASDVREARRAAATERARAAPVKMLFPLVFLVLPAFLLLTVVPVLVTTVQSIA